MGALIVMALVVTVAFSGDKLPISKTQIGSGIVGITGVLGVLGLDVPAQDIVMLVNTVFDMADQLSAESSKVAATAVSATMVVWAAIQTMYRLVTKTLAGAFGNSAK